jgi:2-oxoacid:acceptor oxidoreductase gamma subunit (pyruvate/2-ketoisovalerate family)
MIEIVFYGRGGQGAVTAVQILAQAAFLEGYYAQAFPKFGIERRGASVSAYVRLHDRPIQIRSTVQKPDFAIVGDMMAVSPGALFRGMKPAGTIIINTRKSPDQLQPYAEREGRNDTRVVTVDATGISSRVYGETSIPITSVAMIGAFCAVFKPIQLRSVYSSLEQFFPASLVNKNIKAAQLAFEALKGK